MSKLSFRAKALDASKPMPIYMADELPDLPDYSAINRAVPQMPSGMKKEEECEHHLQRAICTGLIIPTPEVSDIQDEEIHSKLYPANYKQPRQLIHMQPFAMEQDITDYDMDSEDERWLDQQQSGRHLLDLGPLKFEEMMDRLEKSSGQTVVSISDAKALLKEDDDLIIAVFDYWLNKRLKMQHPLILAVKTEHRTGTAPNNPYLAFRRRTEKMQTRKNRKNGETSYEKMLKLRRDLSRAVTLLELVKRREKTKREVVLLTLEVVEKRYAARDFSGAVAAEAAAAACAQLMRQRTGATGGARPAFQPLFHNHHHYAQQQQHMGQYGGVQAGGSGQQGVYADGRVISGGNKAILKDEVICRKERRQYKKRKHKAGGSRGGVIPDLVGVSLLGAGGGLSSDDDAVMQRTSAAPQSPDPQEAEDDGPFAFRRNKQCTYHEALPTICGSHPWQQPSPLYPHLQDDLNNTDRSQYAHAQPDKRYRYTLTSVTGSPRSDGDDDDDDDVVGYWRRKRRRRCIGFARRRLGRGGRVILDRASAPGFPAGLASDEFWASLNYTIYDSAIDAKPAPALPPPSAPALPLEPVTIKQEPATDSVVALIDAHHSYSSCSAQQRRLSNSSDTTSSTTVAGNGNRRTSVSVSVTNGNDAAGTSDAATSTAAVLSVVKVEALATDSVVDSGGDSGSGVVCSRVLLDVNVKEREDEMEMVEFLQHVRRDWLHFRPATPPPSYHPPCHLLPPLSPPPPFFSTDLPFSLELRPIPAYPYTDDGDSPAVLLDDSPFITEPFVAPSLIEDTVWTSGGASGEVEEDERGGGGLRDSGVWSMDLLGCDGDDDDGRGSWKVTEEQEDPIIINNDEQPQQTTSISSSSLPTDSITLNNTKHKPCGNDDDTTTETTTTTIGSSTFTIRQTNPTTSKRKTPPSSSSPTVSSSLRHHHLSNNVLLVEPQEEMVVVKEEECPKQLQQPTTPHHVVTSPCKLMNNVVHHQQRITTATSLVKKQLQGVRGVVTSLVAAAAAGQQGGNGSRAAGLVWRGDKIVGDGIVQTNGLLCGAQLDHLQDVSSGAKPKNNRHHTFSNESGNTGNRSNAINIHGAHSLSLNTHSASTQCHNSSSLNRNQHLTTTVSVSDSLPVVLPHPKVGVGGGPPNNTANTSVAPVQGTTKGTAIVQRKNNNQQLSVMTEVT